MHVAWRVVVTTLTPQGSCVSCLDLASQVHQLLNNWSEPQKANFIRHVTREYEVSCCCHRSPTPSRQLSSTPLVHAIYLVVAPSLLPSFSSWVESFLDTAGVYSKRKLARAVTFPPCVTTAAVACCFPALLGHAAPPVIP